MPFTGFWKYGVLEREDPRSESVTLPISDISEEGGRFNLDLHSSIDFAVHEKLLLKAIIGTRNVTFEEPIELIVVWQKALDANFFFGCEVTPGAEASKSKFLELIRSEKVFSGKWVRSRKTEG
jgi:hypothetical protein